MVRVDEVDMEEQELFAQKEGLAEIKEKVKVMRNQMMHGRQSSEDYGSDSAGNADEISLPSKKRSKFSRSDMLVTTISSSTATLADAISSGISLLAGALQPSPNADTISFDRATELEIQIHEVDKKLSNQLSDLDSEARKKFFSIDEKLERLLSRS
ncbi:hypothetical protein LIPSTDRAFT_135795 [Lipomyces starkeyi NRRL Y-11557]|uniref:Uncharacterized protein n=1 Tax=Lipomyces starkeyi NRRL Y-11557 TaxID=675824 RepID=A0A1E3QHE2_LIPST|nr:hypothetical protein LIPSTDRAFT_135795 [Lipomyces starkeyi NRRL Y-11557]